MRSGRLGLAVLPLSIVGAFGCGELDGERDHGTRAAAASELSVTQVKPWYPADDSAWSGCPALTGSPSITAGVGQFAATWMASEPGYYASIYYKQYSTEASPSHPLNRYSHGDADGSPEVVHAGTTMELWFANRCFDADPSDGITGIRPSAQLAGPYYVTTLGTRTNVTCSIPLDEYQANYDGYQPSVAPRKSVFAWPYTNGQYDQTKAVLWVYRAPNNSSPTTTSGDYEGLVDAYHDLSAKDVRFKWRKNGGAWSYTDVDEPGSPLVPIMTSNTAPAGAVASSGNYSASYPPWQAFDETGSLWLSNMDADSVWIDYTWGGGALKTVSTYQIRYMNGSANQQRAPRDWTLLGCNADATSCVSIDTVTNQTDWYANGTRTFSVDAPGGYARYRLLVTKDNYYDGATFPHKITLVSIGALQFFSGTVRGLQDTVWSGRSGYFGTSHAELLISGLVAGDTIEWQAMSYCSASAGFNSSPYGQLYQSDFKAPYAPIYGDCHWTNDLAGMSSSPVPYGATVSWNPVATATRYTIQYRLAGSYTWYLAGRTSGTSYTIGGLSASTAYEWRVAPNCGAYSDSYGNQVGSFSTPATLCGDGVCAPGESTLSCPADCAPVDSCGDGICDRGEPSTCPEDCYAM